jgi:hypothetical protein
MLRTWPQSARQQDLAQRGGPVGHDPVDPEVKQSMHLGGIVDGPHIYGQPPGLCPRQESLSHQWSAKYRRGNLKAQLALRGRLRPGEGASVRQDLDGVSGRDWCREAPHARGPPGREGGHAHAVPGPTAFHRGMDRWYRTGLLDVHIDPYVRIGLQQLLEAEWSGPIR